VKRVLAIVLLLLAFASGAQGGGRSLLAVIGSGPSTRLAFLDPVSLKPVGRSAQVGRYWWPSARSPDGSRVVLTQQGVVALRGQSAGLRIVDLHRMRTVAAFRIGLGDVDHLDWIASRRILAVGGGQLVLAVDPTKKRVDWTRILPGPYEQLESAAEGLVFLVPPSDGIGPTTLVQVGANGSMRSVVLDRIQSGQHGDEGDAAVIGEVRRAGLAIDTGGNRAFVVGAGEPVAEVDLTTMHVVYHGGSRTLTKAMWSGPVRDAHWLGNGVIAVTGQDARAWIDGNGQPHVVSTPAGLSLIDTTTWTSRMIDRAVGATMVSGDLLLGFGFSYDSTTDQSTGTGLTAYSLDGSRLFHVLDGPIGSVDAGSGFAYAWLPVDEGTVGPRVAIVDLSSGQVLRTATLASPFLALTPS
jgi:hypothetical protein